VRRRLPLGLRDLV